MPNYCYNFITFQGDNKVLKSLEEKLGTYDQSTYFTEWSDYILGIGELDGGARIRESFESKNDRTKESVMLMISDVYYKYGTKWFDFEIESEDGELTVSGDSAWSPPLELVKQICIKYKLTACAEYEEPGNDFGGRTIFNEEGVVSEEDYSYREWCYRENYDNWWNNVYDDIVHSELTLEEAIIENGFAPKEVIEDIYKETKKHNQ